MGRTKQIIEKMRKKPAQKRSVTTVSSILEAATQILNIDGYEAFNTNKVAEKAGLSIGSLYQYFPNKESILVAFVEHHIEHEKKLFEERLLKIQDLPLSQFVEELTLLFFEAFQKRKKFQKIILRELPHISKMKVQIEARNYYEQRIYDKIKDKVASDEGLRYKIQILLRAALGIIITTFSDSPHDLDNEEFRREVTKTAVKIFVV